MRSAWISSTADRYETTLDAFGAFVSECPDELWDAPLWTVRKTDAFVWPVKRAGMKKAPSKAEQERLLPVHSQFWNVAYHTIFHTDLYLSRGEINGWAPPEPFLEADQHGNTVPHRTYTKDELLEYHCFTREKVASTFASMTDEVADAPIAKRMGKHPFSWLLLYNLLHVQEHVAHMGLLFGTHGISPRRKTQGEILREGIAGKDDAGVDAFVKTIGGYQKVVGSFFWSWVPTLEPAVPVVVRFDVGRGFTVRGQKGKATVAVKQPPQIDLTISASDQDFLRWISGDLDLAKARKAGRIRFDGDEDALKRLQTSGD